MRPRSRAGGEPNKTRAIAIVAALDQDLRNESDASRAGALHRLRQLLLDTLASSRFAEATRHAAT
jgi:hypothetical protein